MSRCSRRTLRPAAGAAGSSATAIGSTRGRPSSSCPCCTRRSSRALGVSLRERLELRAVDPTYRLVFDDGSQLSLTSDMKTMREQLEAIEPGSFDGLQRYLRDGARHYRVVAEKMVNREFRHPFDYLRVGALGLLVARQPARQPLPQDVRLLRRAALEERVHVPGPLRGSEPVRRAGHPLAALVHGARAWRLVSGRRDVQHRGAARRSRPRRRRRVRVRLGLSSGSTPMRTGPRGSALPMGPE